jgi:hypothetical protein
VITQRTIGNLLLAYDLMPKANGGPFGDDKVKNAALVTLYEACNLMY